MPLKLTFLVCMGIEMSVFEAFSRYSTRAKKFFVNMGGSFPVTFEIVSVLRPNLVP